MLVAFSANYIFIIVLLRFYIGKMKTYAYSWINERSMTLINSPTSFEMNEPKKE